VFSVRFVVSFSLSSFRQLSLENREAELQRWNKSLGAEGGDASLEGGLAKAEQERSDLRIEVSILT